MHHSSLQSKAAFIRLFNCSGFLQTFGPEGGLNCLGEEHLVDALRSHLEIWLFSSIQASSNGLKLLFRRMTHLTLTRMLVVIFDTRLRLESELSGIADTNCSSLLEFTATSVQCGSGYLCVPKPLPRRQTAPSWPPPWQMPGCSRSGRDAAQAAHRSCLPAHSSRISCAESRPTPGSSPPLPAIHSTGHWPAVGAQN